MQFSSQKFSSAKIFCYTVHVYVFHYLGKVYYRTAIRMLKYLSEGFSLSLENFKQMQTAFMCNYSAFGKPQEGFVEALSFHTTPLLQ